MIEEKVGSVKKVLVVDDDANIRAVLEYRLKSENYLVRLAVDGLDALRQMSMDDYDLVILDLLLPEIDGLNVLQRIKNDPRTSDVPVIVLSALSGSSYCDRATTVGAERYIAKYGMDMKKLAKEFNVTVRTLNNWMKVKKKFTAAIKRGRELSAESIEHTLRQLAMPHDEETVTYEGVDFTEKNKKLKTTAHIQAVKERKIKKGVVSVPAAKMILAADDPNRFSTKIKQEGPVTDALTKILSEIDGKQRGIPGDD